MKAHQVVIRLGRSFSIQVDSGGFLTVLHEITIPFANQEAAESAMSEITVSVRPVRDAGGEDYHPVVTGKVLDLEERAGELEDRLRAILRSVEDGGT